MAVPVQSHQCDDVYTNEGGRPIRCDHYANSNRQLKTCQRKRQKGKESSKARLIKTCRSPFIAFTFFQDQVVIRHLSSHDLQVQVRVIRTLYTDSRSTASFRLGAGNSRHVRSLGYIEVGLSLVHLYLLPHWSIFVPVTVNTCGLRLLVPDPSPSLLIDALPCG